MTVYVLTETEGDAIDGPVGVYASLESAIAAAHARAPADAVWPEWSRPPKSRVRTAWADVPAKRGRQEHCVGFAIAECEVEP